MTEPDSCRFRLMCGDDGCSTDPTIPHCSIAARIILPTSKASHTCPRARFRSWVVRLHLVRNAAHDRVWYRDGGLLDHGVFVPCHFSAISHCDQRRKLPARARPTGVDYPAYGGLCGMASHSVEPLSRPGQSEVRRVTTTAGNPDGAGSRDPAGRRTSAGSAFRGGLQ